MAIGLKDALRLSCIAGAMYLILVLMAILLEVRASEPLFGSFGFLFAHCGLCDRHDSDSLANSRQEASGIHVSAYLFMRCVLVGDRDRRECQVLDGWRFVSTLDDITTTIEITTRAPAGMRRVIRSDCLVG